MKVQVQGKGLVTLTDCDFVAEGGEGKIYLKGEQVYKVYTHPAKMIPAAKIGELAALEHPNIIRPREVILDATGRAIGFTMRRVANALPLARLFTNDFRNRHGITPERTLALIEAMQQVIQFIHDRHCLMVDGNEMNYLVAERNFTEPYFIDVDSYQTSSFPATAIMPSIRDWHAGRHTPLSDWFSFAIVACQLFVGIHPFKGRHTGFKKHDLEGRMKANASIFNRAVTLPPAARDFNHIPAAYLAWFKTLFEQGKREPPPQVAGNLRVARRTPVVKSEAGLSMTLLEEFPDGIVRVRAYGGRLAVLTRSALHIGKAVYDISSFEFEQDVVFAPKSLTPLLIKAELGKLCLKDLRSGRPVACPLPAEHCMVVDNTLYTLHHDNFTEVRISELGDRFFVSPNRVWKVLPHAVTRLQGMLCQSVLGKAHLLIPVEPGACRIIATPELDRYKIVDGRWDRGVAVVIGHKDDTYTRFILRFNRAAASYGLRVEENVDIATINFVTLDNGIVINLNDGGAIEVFSREPGNNGLRTIRTPLLGNGLMSLAKDGTRALLFNDKRLYQISLKS